MKIRLFVILCFLFAGLDTSLIAQENPTDSTNTEQLYVIKRHDGVEYIAKILSDDAREVLIETKDLGKIYLTKADIKSITKIIDKKSIVNGEHQVDGPFTTRYTFTTNALAIKKGENYGLVNLYGPEVHFATSDKFSIGLMTSWIVSPLLLAAKYTIKTKKLIFHWELWWVRLDTSIILEVMLVCILEMSPLERDRKTLRLQEGTLIYNKDLKTDCQNQARIIVKIHTSIIQLHCQVRSLVDQYSRLQGSVR